MDYTIEITDEEGTCFYLEERWFETMDKAEAFASAIASSQPASYGRCDWIISAAN